MSTHVIKAVYMLLRNGLSPQKEAGSDVTIISATHVKSQLLVGRLLALEKSLSTDNERIEKHIMDHALQIG